MPRKQRKNRRLAAGRHWLAELPPATKGNGFRPAIACDGALLLTGAERAGELNRAEARVLAEFLQRVNETGVRA